MKPHHLLVGLLVAVHMLAGAAAASLAYSMRVTWPDPLAAVILGTALGQLAIAAAWLAWGRLLIALRGALLLVVMLGWLFPVANCMGSSDQRRAWWGGILLVHALSVAICLIAVRLTGTRLSIEGEAETPVSRIKPWQFSVGGILTLTTFLAMLLGVGRHLDFPWEEFGSATSFCVGTALAAASSVYLAFRLRTVWLALALPLLLCGGVGYSLTFILHFNALIGMGLLHGVVISISAGVLRVAGYQLASTTAGG